MTLATFSAWDSDVFGVRVGLLKADPGLHVSDVRLNNRGIFDVVFVKASGWDDPGPEAAAVDHLYDMEVQSPRSLGGWKAPGTLMVTANPRHVEIARTAFNDSRFLRDRRLRERAPEMYERWVRGTQLRVLEGRRDDAFLLNSSDADGARRVSLIAVDEGSRGAGLGDALLAGAIGAEPPGTWRVAVSVRNHGAVRFYEKAGFRVARISTAFHVWTAGGMA